MRKDKQLIIEELTQSFNELNAAMSKIDEDAFNVSKGNKWTPAENFQHLATSARVTSLAYSLPKFLPVLLYGRPKRTSHGFSKVVEKYQQKLNGGAKATGLYVPKKTNYIKQELQQKLTKEGGRLVEIIDTKWTDEQLDKFQIAHPILGLLTHRELAYFTIYHNGHHLDTLQKYYL
jgi:hypothetical protein